MTQVCWSNGMFWHYCGVGKIARRQTMVHNAGVGVVPSNKAFSCGTFLHK